MFSESLPEMQMARPIAPSDRAYRFRVSRIAGWVDHFRRSSRIHFCSGSSASRAADQAIAAAEHRRVSNWVVEHA